MSTHPKPADMAREAYPARAEERSLVDEISLARAAYEKGIGAERARVAADMKARAKRIRCRTNDDLAAIVAAFQDTYAGELEDKVTL